MEGQSRSQVTGGDVHETRVLLTIVLYALCLSIFAVPILTVLRYKSDQLLSPFYVFVAPVLILCQAVLLLVPLAVAQERPVKRRSIVASVVIGALPKATMTMVFLASIALMIFGEKGTGDNPYSGWAMTLFVCAALWLAWGIVFWRNFAGADPASMVSNMTRWLLRGSILELVVAIRVTSSPAGEMSVARRLLRFWES